MMLEQFVIKSVYGSLSELFPGSSLQSTKMLVGLSGGADSVSLLIALHTLSKEYGFSVCACHINHMIRGKEADRDEAFAENLCKKLSVPFYSKKIDVPKIAAEKKTGLEETARNIRYEYFEELCSKGIADCIATAHTASDNAETVLFNITRGCGIAGLCGIPKRRGKIIRPLLGVTREDIETFLHNIGQDYVTDSTNLIDDCSRNIIRHRVIPSLCNINPAFHRQVIKLSEIASAENGFLDRLAKENMTDSIDELSKLDRVILSRVIGLKYKEQTGYLPGMNHIENLCNEIYKAAKNNCGEEKFFDFPGNIRIKFECGKLRIINVLEKTDPWSEYDFEPIPGINPICGGKILAVYREIYENNEKLCGRIEYNQNIYSLFTETKLFRDIIKGKIRLRSGLPGDKIRISGMSKDIRKMYSAKKIPVEQRKYLPRIYDSGTGEILSLGYVGVCDMQYDYYDEANIQIGLYIQDDKE